MQNHLERQKFQKNIFETKITIARLALRIAHVQFTLFNSDLRCNVPVKNPTLCKYLYLNEPPEYLPIVGQK